MSMDTTLRKYDVPVETRFCTANFLNTEYRFWCFYIIQGWYNASFFGCSFSLSITYLWKSDCCCPFLIISNFIFSTHTFKDRVKSKMRRQKVSDQIVNKNPPHCVYLYFVIQAVLLEESLSLLRKNFVSSNVVLPSNARGLSSSKNLFNYWTHLYTSTD